MKSHRLGSMAALVACLGMVLSPSAMAATPAVAATNDVALRTGGLLVGQVIDQQGVAKAATPVSIQFAGKEVATTTTDANGVFAAKGLRGGQYQLVTPTGGSVCRLWAADTAPPSARPAALVISSNQVVRAQEPDCNCEGGGPMHSWVGWVKTHPYLTAGTVAAAIAIPLALADDDFDHGS
jgi:hypothetical protein